jgi:hypothetical protein
MKWAIPLSSAASWRVPAPMIYPQWTTGDAVCSKMTRRPQARVKGWMDAVDICFGESLFFS